MKGTINAVAKVATVKVSRAAAIGLEARVTAAAGVGMGRALDARARGGGSA